MKIIVKNHYKNYREKNNENHYENHHKKRFDFYNDCSLIESIY